MITTVTATSVAAMPRDEATPDAGAQVLVVDQLRDIAQPIIRLINSAMGSGRPQRFQFRLKLDGEERTYLGHVIPMDENEVVAVVREIARHDCAEEQVRPSLRNDRREFPNSYQLTFRELTILHLVADGASDKEIANKLTISVFTASKHVSNILSKMNASSRTEASVRAVQEGLLA